MDRFRQCKPEQITKYSKLGNQMNLFKYSLSQIGGNNAQEITAEQCSSIFSISAETDTADLLVTAQIRSYPSQELKHKSMTSLISHIILSFPPGFLNKYYFLTELTYSSVCEVLLNQVGSKPISTRLGFVVLFPTILIALFWSFLTAQLARQGL